MGYFARFIGLAAALCVCASVTSAQTDAKADPGLPKDPKAQKTYADGLAYQHQRKIGLAMDSFKKADKQDGGHCQACRDRIISLSEKTGDFKSADAAAQEAIADAQTPAEQAKAHLDRGLMLMRMSDPRQKLDLFAEADKEFKTVIAAAPDYALVYFADGTVLGHLNQDEAAKAQFEQYLKLEQKDNVLRARAQRYIERPELVRARMAPAFETTTIDGKRISLDDMRGKVVLIDFWATWCPSCIEALPNIRSIAQKFANEPLVILSVSLDRDTDNDKWKKFVAKNQMTWLQTRDSSLADLFGVHVIPHTFTIDADGVLQDEKVGDASIEKKLKKLCADARKLQDAPQPAVAAAQ